MRVMAMVALVLIVIARADGQAGDKGKTIRRFGFDLDTKNYPQGNPKDALASVVKAIGDNRIDYLLAFLADPDFVDKHVAKYANQLDPSLKPASKVNAGFDRLVKETTENFLDDPSKVKDLKRFLADGEWVDQDKLAVASLRNLKARSVFMKRLADERWVLQDREK
jgi:hypothetical protein